MTSTGRPSFSTPHGVIYRIHGNTSDLRPFSQPAFTTGLAQINIFMDRIAQLTDGGFTIHQNHTHLTGGQFNQRVSSLLSHQLGVSSGTSYNLAALTGAQFNIMDLGAQWYIAYRQACCRA